MYHTICMYVHVAISKTRWQRRPRRGGEGFVQPEMVEIAKKRSQKFQAMEFRSRTLVPSSFITLIIVRWKPKPQRTNG